MKPSLGNSVPVPFDREGPYNINESWRRILEGEKRKRLTDNRPIYLDCQATTPVDPRVLEEMTPTFTEAFGNAASKHHRYGWEASKLVETARARIAGLIGCSSKEILFTSGATESNNLALKGSAERLRDKGNHLISVATEHKAILDPLAHLAKMGFEVTLLPVSSEGLIDLGDLESAIRPSTILVSIMAANNEIGTLQPLEQIGAICKEREVLFHTDAAQAVGKIPLDVEAMKIDLLSLSGHKIYGPKGIGALYVRRRNPTVRLTAQMDGGGHERGMRSGTLNVPGIVGMGKACEICRDEMKEEEDRLVKLRESLMDRILEGLSGVRLNGHPTERLPGNLNLSFEGIEAEDLLAKLPDLALSTGSACTTASLEPSHVLKALGLSEEEIQGSIRIGLGRMTTLEEVEQAGRMIVEAVSAMRDGG
ncbi:MAG: IscS subfamily cysteine desulfurase [Candidatus Omnitrophica bacterium]|nr:IscS subfamily cysteine desulfurase [Candidatus Omnitrophota bacterium]